MGLIIHNIMSDKRLLKMVETNRSHGGVPIVEFMNQDDINRDISRGRMEVETTFEAVRDRNGDWQKCPSGVSGIKRILHMGMINDKQPF